MPAWCTIGFTYTISLNSHSHPVGLLTIPHNRGGDWSPERLGNLHKVTATKRMGCECRRLWLHSPCLYHHCPLLPQGSSPLTPGMAESLPPPSCNTSLLHTSLYPGKLMLIGTQGQLRNAFTQSPRDAFGQSGLPIQEFRLLLGTGQD